MRQTISGLLVAVAVTTVGAVPALACGGPYYGACSPCGPAYAGPCAPAAPVYSACDSGCWPHERLPDPVQQYYEPARVKQYYYVNQGPTYTGPGDFAPYPTYQEAAVSGWDAYRHRPYYYGYDGGRYADATNHRYDGAGLDGPVVYSYPAHRHYRPWHHGARHHHQHVLRRYY
jgi:hypothetical protein